MVKKNDVIIEQDSVSLGSRILALRKQKNIGQKEFAIYLHVSISTISNYENDVHAPDLPTLIKIADYFNVSTDYLLNRTQCIYPVAALDTQYIGSYTAANVLNTTLQLTSESQTDLVNYLAMLNLRDKLPKSLTLDYELEASRKK